MQNKQIAKRDTRQLDDNCDIMNERRIHNYIKSSEKSRRNIYKVSYQDAPKHSKEVVLMEIDVVIIDLKAILKSKKNARIEIELLINRLKKNKIGKDVNTDWTRKELKRI